MTDLPADAVGPTPASSLGEDRTISPVAGGLGTRTTGKVVTMAALVVGCGVFMAANWRHGAPKATTSPQEPARQVVAFEPAKATPSPAAAPSLGAATTGAPVLDPTQGQPVGPVVPALQSGAALSGQSQAQAQAQSVAEAKAAQLQAIRAAPILAFSQSSQSAPPRLPGIDALVQKPAEGEATELDKLRHGSVIGLSKASRLPDRNYLITAGTSIPCTLLTAMDTSTPGYVTCLIGQDVYSDNGAVVLLEKGAKVLGEYHSGMHQGQRRLFVLWTRAVTPGGVAIGLASPASDALGRAGFDGAIDTHFWERFGGALLLSIVDDAASSLSQRYDSNGEVGRVPSDAAAVALQNSVNIPPTLTKAQGSQVAIFAAQDFDFSTVYGLKSR
jgi:type IV secretion system protein VirB10